MSVWISNEFGAQYSGQVVTGAPPYHPPLKVHLRQINIYVKAVGNSRLKEK